MSKTATFETNQGTIVAELYETDAPGTVANFEKLANSGFYDGVKFHRVIAEFVVQGGDPLSKDPGKRAQYGTGGLNAVKAEARQDEVQKAAAAAEEAGIPVEPAAAASATVGRGIVGRIGGREVAVGSDRFLVERGVEGGVDVARLSDGLPDAARGELAVDLLDVQWIDNRAGARDERLLRRVAPDDQLVGKRLAEARYLGDSASGWDRTGCNRVATPDVTASRPRLEPDRRH